MCRHWLTTYWGHSTEVAATTYNTNSDHLTLGQRAVSPTSIPILQNCHIGIFFLHHCGLEFWSWSFNHPYICSQLFRGVNNMLLLIFSHRKFVHQEICHHPSIKSLAQTWPLSVNIREFTLQRIIGSVAHAYCAFMNILLYNTYWGMWISTYILNLHDKPSVSRPCTLINHACLNKSYSTFPVL